MTAPRVALLILLLLLLSPRMAAQDAGTDDESALSEVILGLTLAEQGDHENAVRAFELALLQYINSKPLLIELAYSLFKLERNERARIILERVLELDSNDYLGNFNLGILHAVEGRYALAIVYFEHALHAAPNDVDALYCIGLCHIDQGESGRAMDVVRVLATVDKERAAELLEYLNDTDLARNDPLAE